MESTERKRARNACQRCRARKAKCTTDSQFPCRSCLAVGTPCFVVKRKRRVSQTEHSGLPLEVSSGAARYRASKTREKRPNRDTTSSIKESDATLLTEQATSPTHMSQTSNHNWETLADTLHTCREFPSPQSPAAEEKQDAGAGSITRNQHDLASFAANIRLASWLMICPIPHQDNMKNGLTSVLSGGGAKSEELPSIVLQSFDAIRMRVKELHPTLDDGCHCAHHGCCPCCTKGAIYTAHTQCQNTWSRERQQANLLARCERVLELSLGVYDTRIKGATHGYIPGSLSTHGDASVAGPHTMGTNSTGTPLEGCDGLSDTFPSKDIQPGQLVDQTSIYRDESSGEGPLNSFLAIMEWTAQ